jgi:hypothetical protein
MANPIFEEPAALERVMALANGELNGKPLSDAERVTHFHALLRGGHVDTMAPALPLLLNLKGKPYSLVNHFPFEEIFRFRVPSALIYKTGRQVSKSTSLAAHGIIFACSISDKTTLYVTPLFEQVRRFSGMFVQPFIDQSPAKTLWTGTDTVNSVLHRSFRNRSKMLFSFAFLNADRIRGISADKLAIDETWCGITTYVDTPAGKKQLKDLKPGDFVLSLANTLDFRWAPVLNYSYHGYRPCFCLTLANGRTITGTAESRIVTTEGSKRVSQIIEEAAATNSGHIAGRRISRLDERALPQQSRLVPARLQHTEMHDLIRVRWRRTQEKEESRLRRLVELLRHQATGCYVLSRPVLPTGAGRDILKRPAEVQEARQQTMAESDRGSRAVGDDSLVDRRRRQSTGHQEQPSDGFQHARIQQARSATASSLAAAARHRQRCTASEVQIAQSRILDHKLFSCRHAKVDRELRAARGTANAIQGYSVTHRDSGVLLLRTVVPAPGPADAGPAKAAEEAVLPGGDVPTGAAQRAESALDGQTREARRQKRTATRTLLRGRRGESRQGPRVLEDAPREESAERGCGQAAVSGKTARRENGDAAGLSALRERVHACNAAGTCTEILPDVQTENCSADQKALVIEASEIVDIEYVGYRDVYDFETDDNHVFMGNGCALLQCQDMNREHLSIIRETLSASDWALRQFTGTPKTLDNTLEGLWQESSQAEWFVPCMHCTTNGFPTWNIPSMEFHLEKMIGGWHNDISEARPATVCRKCGKSISPRLGRWVHRYPQRIWQQAGYHVPQVIMPMHYAKKDKWAELLAKMAGKGNTPLNVFYNEVLGESYDTAAKLVTMTEINKVSTLGPNTPEYARGRCGQYRFTVLAVDWGGGGEKQISFTTVALLGATQDGRIDVLFGKRLLTPHDHLREAKEIKQLWDMFRPTVLAHDYTGAGALRETFLIQAGVPTRCVMPCMYVRSASQQPCYHVAPTQQHPRSHYRVDKSRTLLLTCAMIKCGRLHFFDADFVSQEEPGLIQDFLALVEDKVTTMAAGEIYRITRQEGFTDDFAQAVNLGCVAIWYRTHEWPQLAAMADYALTDEQLRAAAPQTDSDWDDEVL